jgi:hypothetical protein
MSPKFFNIGEIAADNNQPPGDEVAGLHVEKFLSVQCIMVENLKKLIGRYPQEGEIFFLFTVKSFNAFTFIPYINKHCGTITELILSTYSINIRIIDALIRMIDKDQVLAVHIFISDSIRGRLPKVYDHLMALTETKPVQVRYAWNHSKIALIRCLDHHFVVEGSGNWGENAQYEQYVFLDSAAVFEFRKNQIIHAINSTAT